MQGAGKTFNTGTEDWKWWSSIIGLAYYFWKREILIFIWQATWHRQICWKAVKTLPHFKLLRTGLLLSVFNVFHIFILMRYLRLSFLRVWANPCLSVPLITCKNTNCLSYCSKWKVKKNIKHINVWCHSSPVPWQYSLENIKAKFQPLHLLQTSLEILLSWTQPFLLYYFSITMLQQCSQPEGNLLISLQICREIWKNPGFLTVHGLSPCITHTHPVLPWWCQQASCGRQTLLGTTFQVCSGLVTGMAERDTLSPRSAGPNLHDNRFGMETWHAEWQKVTAAKKTPTKTKPKQKDIGGGKEQLGKRSKVILHHLRSYCSS